MTSSKLKTASVSMRGTSSKVISTTRKLMDAPQRLLQEADINELLEQDLCDKCRAHCDGFVHLTSGRGA